MTPKVEIVVEGRDDEVALRRLLKARGINPDDPAAPRVSVDKIVGQNRESGISELLVGIGVRIKNAPGGCVAFVVDADTDPAARWAQVRDRMRELDVDAPDILPAEGFDGYTASFNAHVGCWMMPDNLRAGAIEAFLLAMTDHRKPLVDHARASRDHASALGAAFKKKDADKAHLLTYLAWQDEPDSRYGIAIATGALLTAAPEADAFVDWVRRLLVRVGEDASMSDVP